MKKILIIILFVMGSLPTLQLSAIETAPRISDKEIIERLTRLEEGQRDIEKRIEDLDAKLNKRIDDLDRRLNGRIDDLRSDMNSRFYTLQWMLGLFITIALAILGFVLRMQWQMQKRQTRIETALETQKDEINFLKGIIEKLLPPKGVM